VAHWLRDRGFEAYAVVGGVAAVQGEELAELGPEAGFADVAERVAVRALTTLRHRSFRLYSLGVLISMVGGWVEAAAFGYVVLLLGGSAATLGLIGFLNTVPNLVLGLPAGALADRYDRRKLLLVFQTANLGVSAALAAMWATGSLTLGTMGALAVVGGSLGTLSFPAFQGMLAGTVPSSELGSAVAVNSLSLQVARFVGPAIAGFLLAAAGPTWVFGANAASFGVVLATLALVPASRSVGTAVGGIAGSITDGVRYVFGQRSIASLMALLILAGLFGTPPVAFMIPGIVRYNLGGGGGTLGLVSAAIGLGSVAGSIALLRLSARPAKGSPLLFGYFATAVAVAAIGASHVLGLSLVLAVLGGFAGVLFVGLSTVVVQVSASDEMRARAMAIWAAAFVGMLPIGALITSGLAAWLGAGGAVLVDGLVVLVGGAVIFLARPELRWLGCAALPEACLVATEPSMAAAMVPLGGPRSR
jgi:MFS family permease